MATLAAPVASLSNVRKRYGKTVALDGLDLTIDKASIVALLGPNGAGKSTAISLLLGLANADAGQVKLFERSPHELAARRRIGVMLQSAALPDTLRVGELIELTSSYYSNPRAIVETARIAGVERLLKSRYGALSGGQQRRAQFALAICGNPELLFLDEPTTGLDIEAREAVWSAVQLMVRNGCAVLLTTHYIEEAEALADRVVVLMRGRVITTGSVDELRAQSAKRRIRCVTKVDAAHVSAWPGVSAARRRDRWLEIEAPTAESIVRRLLDTDAQLTELEVQRAGLGEAFAQITQENPS
jgi:ABC-2 type transport system ATP-binding protein